MMQVRDFPTYGELFAIEHAARRAQAAELSRLIALGFRKLIALVRKAGAILSGAFHQPTTGGRSGNSLASPTFSSIMRELSESLPDDVRARYGEELATAIRVAPVLDLGFAAWEFTVRVLAQGFRSVAQGLRAGAWCLDAAARRLIALP